MRAVLGPLVLNLLFLGTGYCVVYATGATAGARQLLLASGLAFMAGLALVVLVAIALLTLGLAPHPLTVVVAALAIGGAALAVGGRRPSPRHLRLTRPALGLRTCLQWCRSHPAVSVGIVAVLVYAGLGCFRASVAPTAHYDSWAIWMRKALLLTDFNSLPVPFFTGHAYVLTHQDYPLLLPLTEAIWFRFAGHIDTVSVNLEQWLMLIGFVGAAAFLLSRAAVRHAGYLAVLAALAVAPGLTSQVFTGYADLPLSMFAGLGILAAGLWVAGGEGRLLAFAAIFLGAAANVKNEGLPIAVIVLIAALVFRPHSGTRRAWLLAAAGVFVAVLPWHLWVMAHHVPSDPDLQLHRFLDPGYLVGRDSRLGLTVTSLSGQLAAVDQWLLLAPLGMAAAITAVVRRYAPRLAGFYLSVGIATFVVYLFVYWASGLDINWYLGTSAYRVIDVIVFMAALTAGHLASGAPRSTAPPS